MTWYMNFCAPFIPNDPTINFHRFVQGILLLLYSLMYAGVHFYYMYYGPLPLVPEDEHDSTPLSIQNKTRKKAKKNTNHKIHKIPQKTKKFLSNSRNNQTTLASNSKKQAPPGTKSQEKAQTKMEILSKALLSKKYKITTLSSSVIS